MVPLSGFMQAWVALPPPLGSERFRAQACHHTCENPQTTRVFMLESSPKFVSGVPDVE